MSSSQRGNHENELVTLRARAKTAESTKRINQQLAKVDASSTLAMLERMKEKVQTEEALAQGYGEITELASGVDAEIDRALLTAGPSSAETALLEMKRKMGLLPSDDSK